MTSTSILTHLRPSGSCQSQPAPNWLFRRVIADLARDGEFRLSEIRAEYDRRLQAARNAA